LGCGAKPAAEFSGNAARPRRGNAAEKGKNYICCFTLQNRKDTLRRRKIPNLQNCKFNAKSRN